MNNHYLPCSVIELQLCISQLLTIISLTIKTKNTFCLSISPSLPPAFKTSGKCNESLDFVPLIIKLPISWNLF